MVRAGRKVDGILSGMKDRERERPPKLYRKGRSEIAGLEIKQFCQLSYIISEDQRGFYSERNVSIRKAYSIF